MNLKNVEKYKFVDYSIAHLRPATTSNKRSKSSRSGHTRRSHPFKFKLNVRKGQQVRSILTRHIKKGKLRLNKPVNDVRIKIKSRVKRFVFGTKDYDARVKSVNARYLKSQNRP